MEDRSFAGISDTFERKNIILPKTFVHIHTALAEAEFLLKREITPYVVVNGTDKQGIQCSVSGEVVKIIKEWSEGISTIVIKPENNEVKKEITIGGKYALFEDVRMETLILDEVHSND